MTCIEEGWHMWDEIRIFGDDGLIELRRPLKYPIGWDLTVMTRRGDALEPGTADPTPGAATTNFLDAVRGRAPVACSFADAVVPTNIVERAFESAYGECAWLPLAAGQSP